MPSAPPTCPDPKCKAPMERAEPRIGVWFHPAEMLPDEPPFRGGWACTECGLEVEDEEQGDDE